MTLLPLLLLAPETRTLIVGGGPSRRYNQVAIESNVRYFTRIIPKEWPFRILFADGDEKAATVRYVPDGGTEGKDDKYRAPQIDRLDGPAQLAEVKREVSALAASPSKSPVFLYFTGHGSLVPNLTPDTSQFDLWRRESVTVPQLAEPLATFPKGVPVTLLMVQCHSGGFAKLLFRNGDPGQGLVPDSRVCGFFASIEPRLAAGCTSAVNEAYYRDFTTYFVAALTGVDRLGRKSTGADTNKDGKVGMNEAYCWALANDDSIDTPVCTSDEFLRFAVKTPDAEVFATPYADVLRWAAPEQRAALDSLSASVKLTGEDRLKGAYAKYVPIGDDEEDMDRVRGYRFVRLAKSVILGHAMARTSDRALKSRYETLLKDEAANPLHP